MQLRRTGRNGCTFSHDDTSIFDADENARIGFRFLSFGKGTSNTSALWAEMQWSDIKIVIEEFGKLGHPEALQLQHALNLAQSVKNIVAQ